MNEHNPVAPSGFEALSSSDMDTYHADVVEELVGELLTEGV